MKINGLKLFALFLILFLLLTGCSNHVRMFNKNYVASYFMYYTKDFFGRKYFKWVLSHSDVYKEKSPHIRVYLNRNSQIIVYEENEFVTPNYTFMVDRRELTNIFESFLWYAMDGFIMIYRGSKVYFTQERIIKAKKVGFLKYDNKGRLIEEEIYDKYGKEFIRIKFIYKDGIMPVKKIEDEILYEKVSRGVIVRKISRRTYFYKDENIVKIISKEFIENL